MIRLSFALTPCALALLSSAMLACAARRGTKPPAAAPAPMVMPSVPVADDAAVTTAFRALLDEVIGDSADKVCLAIATSAGSDVDPSAGVMHSLAGHGRVQVFTRSACAADERNFGNPRGLLRLRDVTRSDEHTLIVHADAVGDHTARYECVVPDGGRGRCRITSRD